DRIGHVCCGDLVPVSHVIRRPLSPSPSSVPLWSHPPRPAVLLALAYLGCDCRGRFDQRGQCRWLQLNSKDGGSEDVGQGTCLARSSAWGTPLMEGFVASCGRANSCCARQWRDEPMRRSLDD